jgi:glutathione peroxidase
MTSIYDVSVNRADGTATTLADYRGKVMLIVNVASACGLTPQYTALEAAFEKYRERGFVVVAFPCNDFGAQEPGSAAEIAEFCSTKFHVQFPVLDKIGVAPEHRHPLYRELIAAQPEGRSKAGSDFKAKMAGYGIVAKHPEDILWNFEKFLVSRGGEVVARFTPDTEPDDALITAAIEAQLSPAA